MSEQDDNPKAEPEKETSSELGAEELEGVSGGISGPGPIESTDNVTVRVR